MPKQLDETPSPATPISHLELMHKTEAFTKRLEKGVADRFMNLQTAQGAANTVEAFRRAVVDTFLDLFFREQAGRPDEIAEALGNRPEFAETYEISLRYFDLPPFPVS